MHVHAAPLVLRAISLMRLRVVFALLHVLTFVPLAGLDAQPSPTAIVGRIRSTSNKPIDFHAAAFPDSVYVGQQITYQVAVLLSDQARTRLRRNPEFLPPELRGLLAYELGSPTRVPSRVYGGGLAYEAHVFQRALFGVTAGALKVPAPQLTYSLPQSSSYFAREERYVVRAESAQIVVKALPLAERPDDFTGAVGVLRATARFDQSGAGTTVRVGDPLVLTVRVEGTGNVKLWPRPTVELSWATVVAGSERVQVDTTGSLVRGAKEFDFLLTPSQAGAVALPVVRYAYFDPYRAAYAYAQTTPAEVRIADGDLASAGSADESDALPLRVWRKQDALAANELPATFRWLALLLIALAPLPALLLATKRSRRPRSNSIGYPLATIAREEAADDTSPPARARRTRRELLTQLATRLHVIPTELVTRADLERVLRRRGVTRKTTRELLQLLDELDAQGFGGESARPTTALDTRAGALMATVNDEAVRHGRTRLWARRVTRSVGTLMLMAGAEIAASSVVVRPVLAQTIDLVSPRLCADMRVTPRSALTVAAENATIAYKAHRYTKAAQEFAEAAARCPRDVDLLFNWGTAAWTANDTVAAVIAWQRAARLDPLAADLQERVALLPPGARDGVATVPLVPVTALIVMAVAAWMAAWLLYFLSWKRNTEAGTMTLLATLLLFASVAAGGTAWWGYRALDASGLAVVRRPETLRTAPGYEANTAGGVATGDIVRMATAQEGWLRIEHSDGRSGWIPASRLAPLVAGPTTR